MKSGQHEKGIFNVRSCREKLSSVTTPLPGDDRPMLKDFLYVDLPRVRSFLGQLYAGTPEKVEEIQEKLSKWSIGASLGVLKGEGGKQSLARSHETRSFGDLHFTMFEETAEAVGFLTDISDLANMKPNWTNGRLDRVTGEGSIIRITGPTTITDAKHFADMIEQVVNTGLITEDGAQTIAQQMGAAVKAMYTQGISIRVAPLGEDHLDHSLTGTLLEKSEHIEPERSSLYERYGTGFRDWTTVGIVARKGTNPQTPNLADFNLAMEGGRLDRARFEQMMKMLTTYMETTGLTEAPTYPGLAIIPLAVYRTIQASKSAIPL